MLHPALTVTPLSRAACATLPFVTAGKLRVAVIVKATFRLVPDAAMVLVDPDPIARADVRHRGDPRASLLVANDLVPYRPRTDIVLTGHARAPFTAPGPRVTVRLAVWREQQRLCDKRVVLVGASGAPAPVVVPLAWELAAAGPGNPVGMAAASGRQPSMLDAYQRPTPVGLGPIAPDWPARRALMRYPGAFATPIAQVPADFDWSYFQVAPEDQRADFLQGDEWLALEGVSHEHPKLQSQLPRARAVARVYSPAIPNGKAIVLQADTLAVDADRLCASVVWRGSCSAQSEAELAALQLYAGVTLGAQELAFPAKYEPFDADDFVATTALAGKAGLADAIRSAVKGTDARSAEPVEKKPTGTSPSASGMSETTGLDAAGDVAAQIRAAAAVPFPQGHAATGASGRPANRPITAGTPFVPAPPAPPFPPAPPLPPPAPPPPAPPPPAPQLQRAMSETAGLDAAGGIAAQIRASMAMRFPQAERPRDPAARPAVTTGTPFVAARHQPPVPTAAPLIPPAPSFAPLPPPPAAPAPPVAAVSLPVVPNHVAPAWSRAAPPREHAHLGMTAGPTEASALGAQVRAALPFPAGGAKAPGASGASIPAAAEPAPPKAANLPLPRPPAAARPRKSALEETAGLGSAEDLAAQIRAAFANPFGPDASDSAAASDGPALEPSPHSAQSGAEVRAAPKPPALRVRRDAAPLDPDGATNELVGLGSAFLAALERIAAVERAQADLT